MRNRPKDSSILLSQLFSDRMNGLFAISWSDTGATIVPRTLILSPKPPLPADHGYFVGQQNGSGC